MLRICQVAQAHAKTQACQRVCLFQHTTERQSTRKTKGQRWWVGFNSFILADDHKFFYHRGLTEYPKVKEYLIDTCLSAQDNYKKMLDYFLPKSNK